MVDPKKQPPSDWSQEQAMRQMLGSGSSTSGNVPLPEQGSFSSDVSSGPFDWAEEVEREEQEQRQRELQEQLDQGNSGEPTGNWDSLSGWPNWGEDNDYGVGEDESSSTAREFAFTPGEYAAKGPAGSGWNVQPSWDDAVPVETQPSPDPAKSPAIPRATGDVWPMQKKQIPPKTPTEGMPANNAASGKLKINTSGPINQTNQNSTPSPTKSPAEEEDDDWTNVTSRKTGGNNTAPPPPKTPVRGGGRGHRRGGGSRRGGKSQARGGRK